ncbi:MAG: dual-specificity RNA methyltransferase RlmN [Planctomycetota bacterium]|jgi:23S rRNA (adenine2503-C2)-methyltransferase
MSKKTKTQILELSKEELADFIESISEPRFRTGQLIEWIFKKKADSFDDMKNIPKSLREKLAENFTLRTLQENRHLTAKDNMTEKWLFETPQSHGVESVLIREEKRKTACVSCALGCPLNCRFCASAEGEFLGDLTAAEMVEQVMLIEKAAEERISNVVFMGTGEPFLNYDNVLKAAKIINSPDGLGIGARHITISTAGVITGIERFAAEPEDFRMAVSLHAANQKAREKIIPSAKKWKLNRLISAIRRYSRTTRREVTFEYILINGFNCHQKDALELCDLIKGIPCKVNCIPFNSVRLKTTEHWQAPDKETCRDFINTIKENGIRVTLRQEKGTDIAAACGQLRAYKELENKE